MAAEEKREKSVPDGKLSGEKLLTAALYVVTTLCILGFIVQSIASMLIAQ